MIRAGYKATLAPIPDRNAPDALHRPLRFYHCLMAGVEVVSTPLPQAQEMSLRIHIVIDVDTSFATLQAILE
jgi:hypothetical protein